MVLAIVTVYTGLFGKSEADTNYLVASNDRQNIERLVQPKTLTPSAQWEANIAKINASQPQLAQIRVDQATAHADQLAREAAQVVQTASVAEIVKPAQVAPAVPSTGDHATLMASVGISPSDYGYVEFILNHESGWRVQAMNPSGAYGLCQSLPGNKMASAGGDWATNPVTQLSWCNSYAISRYGSWASAYNFWIQSRWW